MTPSATAVADRNALWHAITEYRENSSSENEQAVHHAMDAYEAASESARPPFASDVAERLGDIMTDLENGMTFKDFDAVKKGYTALTNLQREVYMFGIQGAK